MPAKTINDGFDTAGQALHPITSANKVGDGDVCDKSQGIKPVVSSLARSCPCKHGRDLAPFVNHLTVGDIATNCWIYSLLETDVPPEQNLPPGFQGCAVIDPGADADIIISRLAELKMIPLYILLTHGHFDHIAAVPGLISAYRKTSDKYPIIAIHRDDAEYLGPASYAVHCVSFSAATGDTSYIDSLWEDMPSEDRKLEDGDTIGPFTVIHLPGHTPGSIAFWDKEAQVLFSGDTLFRSGYGRTDLPGGNESKLFASLQKLFAMDSSIKVYPGHGSATTIGQEVGRGLF